MTENKSLISKLSQLLATPFIRYSDFLFVYSVLMILFGGFGYMIFDHVTLIKSYEMHYRLILAIIDPFSTNLSNVGKIFGVVDTLSALLLFPTVVYTILAKTEESLNKTKKLLTTQQTALEKWQTALKEYREAFAKSQEESIKSKEDEFAKSLIVSMGGEPGTNPKLQVEQMLKSFDMLKKLTDKTKGIS